MVGLLFHYIGVSQIREDENMLVLGRKPGEYIMIDNNIMIKVVRSSKGDLRLAIDAPREMIVTRGEVYEEQLQRIAE